MPELQIYRDWDFPDSLNWQAVSFMRVAWPGIEGGLLTRTYPATLDPTHFALIDGPLLLSYAATILLPADHAGRRYRIGGMGNVFTYPSFRRRGFGAIVIRAATAALDAGDADVGCLFCAPTLVPFYEAAGWTPIAGARTTTGAASAVEIAEEVRMMRFISDSGRAGQRDFATRDLHLDHVW